MLKIVWRIHDLEMQTRLMVARLCENVVIVVVMTICSSECRGRGLIVLDRFGLHLLEAVGPEGGRFDHVLIWWLLASCCNGSTLFAAVWRMHDWDQYVV